MVDIFCFKVCPGRGGEPEIFSFSSICIAAPQTTRLGDGFLFDLILINFVNTFLVRFLNTFCKKVSASGYFQFYEVQFPVVILSTMN